MGQPVHPANLQGSVQHVQVLSLQIGGVVEWLVWRPQPPFVRVKRWDDADQTCCAFCNPKNNHPSSSWTSFTPYLGGIGYHLLYNLIKVSALLRNRSQSSPPWMSL